MTEQESSLTSLRSHVLGNPEPNSAFWENKKTANLHFKADYGKQRSYDTRFYITTVY